MALKLKMVKGKLKLSKMKKKKKKQKKRTVRVRRRQPSQMEKEFSSAMSDVQNTHASNTRDFRSSVNSSDFNPPG